MMLGIEYLYRINNYNYVWSLGVQLDEIISVQLVEGAEPLKIGEEVSFTDINSKNAVFKIIGITEKSAENNSKCIIDLQFSHFKKS